MHWAIPENIQTGVLRTWFFEKDPWIFRYVILPLEISDKRQNKASPLGILQNRVTSIGISGQKPRPMETLHNFFWITFRNSTSFFYWPWNFHNLFFNNPGNSMSSSDFDVFNKGWVWFFKYSSYRKSTVFMNFHNLLLKFYVKSFKNTFNWFFPLSHHQKREVVIEASGKKM